MKAALPKLVVLFDEFQSSRSARGNSSRGARRLLIRPNLNSRHSATSLKPALAIVMAKFAASQLGN